MNKRLEREYDIVNVAVVLLDRTADETLADTEVSLICQCDQVVESLIGASRGLSKHGPNELRQMVKRIASTDAANESELIAKVAVYREYVNFLGGRSGLLETMLGTCCDDIERELLRRRTRELAEV